MIFIHAIFRAVITVVIDREVEFLETGFLKNETDKGSISKILSITRWHLIDG